MMEKACTECREVKAATAFYAKRSGAGGIGSICKSCHRVKYGQQKRDAAKLGRANRKSLSEYASDPAIVARFMGFVPVGEPDECWPWQGATNSGYGWFTIATGVQEVASRFALAVAGVDPGELHALHSCNNRPCCNPGHLRPGTNADNIRDCAMAGNHCLQKLSHTQANEIRELVSGGMKKTVAARLYGVVPTTVGDICSFRTHNVSQELT